MEFLPVLGNGADEHLSRMPKMYLVSILSSAKERQQYRSCSWGTNVNRKISIAIKIKKIKKNLKKGKKN